VDYVTLYPRSSVFPERKSIAPGKSVGVRHASSHHSELSLDGGLIIQFLLPNVTIIMQPMDQDVITSMKQHYLAGPFRTLVKEDYNVMTFLGEDGTRCPTWHVFSETSNAGSVVEKTSSSSRGG
jgi:hypothetical protein